MKVKSSNSHMNKCAGAFESATPGKSGQKAIVEEISLRHQLNSVPDAADDAIANEIESGTAHVIHSVLKLQDNIDEVPIHGTDIELTPILGHSPKVNPKDNINLTMVVSNENIHVLDWGDHDEKVCTNTGKKQPRIIRPSGKTLHNNVTGKMAQKGLMMILSRKDGKGTVSDDKENEKVELKKF